MNVREAIVADPRVVQAEANVREAAELLTHPNVESVLVVNGDELVGCVTPDSIVVAVAAGVDLGSATAAAVADGNVSVIGPDVPVDEALRLMGEQDLERIAVVEKGHFLGVLPRRPLVRRLAEDVEAPTDAQEDSSEQPDSDTAV